MLAKPGWDGLFDLYQRCLLQSAFNNGNIENARYDGTEYVNIPGKTKHPVNCFCQHSLHPTLLISWLPASTRNLSEPTSPFHSA